MTRLEDISQKSWHYRLLNLFLEDIEKDCKNICSYFWSVVAFTSMTGIAILSFVFFVMGILYKTPAMAVSHILIVIQLSMILILVSNVNISHKIRNKIKRLENSRTMEIFNNIFMYIIVIIIALPSFLFYIYTKLNKKKRLNLLWQYLKSRKEKSCRLINYTDK